VREQQLELLGERVERAARRVRRIVREEPRRAGRGPLERAVAGEDNGLGGLFYFRVMNFTTSRVSLKVMGRGGQRGGGGGRKEEEGRGDRSCRTLRVRGLMILE
jgi:hypothetical protein